MTEIEGLLIEPLFLDHDEKQSVAANGLGRLQECDEERFPRVTLHQIRLNEGRRQNAPIGPEKVGEEVEIDVDGRSTPFVTENGRSLPSSAKPPCDGPPPADAGFLGYEAKVLLDIEGANAGSQG